MCSLATLVEPLLDTGVPMDGHGVDEAVCGSTYDLVFIVGIRVHKDFQASRAHAHLAVKGLATAQLLCSVVCGAEGHFVSVDIAGLRLPTNAVVDSLDVRHNDSPFPKNII